MFAYELIKKFLYSFLKKLEKKLKKLYHVLPLPQKIKIGIKKIYFKSIVKFKKKSQEIVEIFYVYAPPLEKVQQDGVADVFIWAVIDWHFRIQRPQHIAKNFAELGHRVFYFSNNFVNNDFPGFRAEKLYDELELYCIHLHVSGPLQIYYGKAPANTLLQLQKSMNYFYQWSKTRNVFSIVQHPFWFDLVQRLPNQTLIYDCMDYHGGFKDNVSEILTMESSLIEQADILVVTSKWLYQELSLKNNRIALIRNACEYHHFATQPSEIFQEEYHRKIIGYYGAIAEWFDIELVEKIAQHFSDTLILLVGNDTVNAGHRLKKYSNILMTGEVSYQQLPYYLYAMTVCVIPFQVIPLTLATNPVKAYEYLSSGKPVVSVDLPELHEFEGNVILAKTHQQFIESIGKVLVVTDTKDEILRRMHFAEAQTWIHRVTDMKAAIQAQAYPLISIIVVTYNNLIYTKSCLYSIEEFTDYPNYELIIVDNNSTDETPAYLQNYADLQPHCTLILNQDNLGFAAANNQGLRVARGDYIVLLNNDTYVTAGWLSSLYRHFKRNPLIGMIGPITNNIGNEAKIEICYNNVVEMAERSKTVTLEQMGVTFSIPVLAFFCVMFSRKIYEKVGMLDEEFGIGMFEDDDYCQRVKKSGFQIHCADDVFIHHHLSASFDLMGAKRKQALFEKNKLIYEKKWGAWHPHKSRNKNN